MSGKSGADFEKETEESEKNSGRGKESENEKNSEGGKESESELNSMDVGKKLL